MREPYNDLDHMAETTYFTSMKEKFTLITILKEVPSVVPSPDTSSDDLFDLDIHIATPTRMAPHNGPQRPGSQYCPTAGCSAVTCGNCGTDGCGGSWFCTASCSCVGC